MISLRKLRSTIVMAIVLAGAALFAAKVRPLPIAGAIVAAVVLMRIVSMLLPRRRQVVVTSCPIQPTASELPKSTIRLIERP